MAVAGVPMGAPAYRPTNAAQIGGGQKIAPLAVKGLQFAVPLAVGALIWYSPAPAGLDLAAWRMFAIFAATILGLLCQPMPSGAVMIVAMTVSVLTGILTEAKALAGFTNSTVWLIFAAYVISVGFLNTGLGRRIAYAMIARLGGSTLGTAYALGISDLIFSPAMPSSTARSGGVIFPVVRSITEALDARPDQPRAKLGRYLMLSCFLISTITGGLSMTGMAANPLAASLAKQTANVNITWMGWLTAAIVPGLVCFAIAPLLIYWLVKPGVTKTEGAREIGRQGLADLGKMGWREWVLAGVFVLALVGWATGTMTGLSATAVALAAVALLFLTGAVTWREVLGERAAWDTLIWFGAIVGLATALSDMGFIKWMTAQLAGTFAGWSWLAVFLAIGLVYVYSHYAFATATGHVAAVYAPFLVAGIAAGVPPMMLAITLGIFSNLMWGLTEYGGGPGPIYFAQGYFHRARFYASDLVVVTVNLVVMFTVGMAWWKVIGLW